MKIIGLCVGLLIGFGACQSHRDTVVGIRAEGIPVPEKVVLSISDSTYEIFPPPFGAADGGFFLVRPAAHV